MFHLMSGCTCTGPSNNGRMIRNSSKYILGLLACAVVIAQALATAPGGGGSSATSRSRSKNVSPWGTRGGSASHVKKSRPGGDATPSSSSALSMSSTEKESSRSNGEKGSSEVDKIPSPSIIVNGLSSSDSASSFHNQQQQPPHGDAAKKVKKTIYTHGGYADEIVPATYIAETNLPTDVGHFRIRAYRIEGGHNGEPNPLGAGAGLGKEPCVIYCTDKPPFGGKGGERGGAKEVPVRIHDQCFTSEVFRSQR